MHPMMQIRPHALPSILRASLEQGDRLLSRQQQCRLSRPCAEPSHPRLDRLIRLHQMQRFLYRGHELPQYLETRFLCRGHELPQYLEVAKPCAHPFPKRIGRAGCVVRLLIRPSPRHSGWRQNPDSPCQVPHRWATRTSTRPCPPAAARQTRRLRRPPNLSHRIRHTYRCHRRNRSCRRQSCCQCLGLCTSYRSPTSHRSRAPVSVGPGGSSISSTCNVWGCHGRCFRSLRTGSE